jgi:cyclophilin family peptidyl-prolyl cis-trans isomerase
MRRSFWTVVTLASFIAASCAEDRGVVATDKKAGDGKNPVVVMETSLGTMKIELDPVHAPGTVKNFLAYVDDKFYDGTIFHRVIEDFMIQGGGFKPSLTNAKSKDDILDSQKPTRDPIKNESPNGLSNTRGTIAMARTDKLDSATAQFYINVDDNSRKLDAPRYCVFGKVIEGMDVADKIRAVKTKTLTIGGRPAMGDVPAESVLIKSVRRADSKDPSK